MTDERPDGELEAVGERPDAHLLRSCAFGAEGGADADRELERRLVDLALERAPIFLFVLDDRGIFVAAEGAGSRAHVDEPGRIVGHSIEEWAEDVPDGLAAVGRALGGEEVDWRGAVGERFYEAHLSPVLDRDGRLIVVAGVALDRTAAHQTELSLRARLTKLERIVRGTIQALDDQVEGREPHHAGHQRRTAELAVAIAQELGWSAPRLENVEMAARLHDIGRLTCPAEALNRPGPLSAEEVQLIQAHAAAGAAMLADMGFEGPIVSAVRQHHERIDGSGYPLHLERAAILPEAKVIAVADVLDGMTSPRPYRAAYGLPGALTYLRAERGRLFDEEIVDACARLVEGGSAFGGGH